MSKSLNIVFFSSSGFTIPLIQKLQSLSGKPLKQLYNQEKIEGIDFNYIPTTEQITLILEKYGDYILNFDMVISASDKLNRNKLVSNPVTIYAKDNGIKYYNPLKLKENFDEFIIAHPSLNLGIVASYGQILTQTILDSFEYGIINWHPSLLPKYRGPTPMQTVLNNGDLETGLSWINMTKGMDAGDILVQTQTELHNNWDIDDLSSNMVETGCQTLILAIITNLGYRDKELNLQLGQEQNTENISFTKMLDKNDRIIEPNRLTAEQIHNHYKAYKSFPGSVFYDDYFKQNLKITLATDVTVDLDNYQKISETTNFIQIKDQNELKTYLKTAAGYLQLQEIMLENGKKVQLKGYLFKPN